MNLQSIRWAFNAGRQHCTHPGQLTVLLVIASAVGTDHRGCVLSPEQLASASVMTAEEVQTHVESLECIGLIHRGDQSLGMNFAPDRRPTVWDLAHADRSGPTVRGRTTTDLPAIVYRFFDTDDRLLYIGVTLDRDVRWANHAAKREWWPKVARNTMTWFETGNEAYRAEREAILAEHPIYNEARYTADHWHKNQN